jgi:putative transposase
VIQRGNNRGAIFFEEADRRFYLGWLGEALTDQNCALHAYVLMTNHVHLLITSDRSEAVPKALQSLGRRYVRYVNRTYGRTGTLWEGRYKSTILDSERYVLACHRYIEANPVRARMVAAAGDYSWLSHSRNAGGRADPLLPEHPVDAALGATPAERQEAYRKLFSKDLDPELVMEIRDATNRGWVPGSERFRRKSRRPSIARSSRRDEDVRRRCGMILSRGKRPMPPVANNPEMER